MEEDEEEGEEGEGESDEEMADESGSDSPDSSGGSGNDSDESEDGAPANSCGEGTGTGPEGAGAGGRGAGAAAAGGAGPTSDGISKKPKQRRRAFEAYEADFIDDDEEMRYEKSRQAKAKYDGFFINQGAVELEWDPEAEDEQRPGQKRGPRQRPQPGAQPSKAKSQQPAQANRAGGAVTAAAAPVAAAGTAGTGVAAATASGGAQTPARVSGKRRVEGDQQQQQPANKKRKQPLQDAGLAGQKSPRQGVSVAPSVATAPGAPQGLAALAASLGRSAGATAATSGAAAAATVPAGPATAAPAWPTASAERSTAACRSGFGASGYHLGKPTPPCCQSPPQSKPSLPRLRHQRMRQEADGGVRAARRLGLVHQALGRTADSGGSLLAPETPRQLARVRCRPGAGSESAGGGSTLCRGGC
ncbi:hypothetical protein Vafri_2845 [Volvox africanus]|uniref:Hpc2-related domain-containing protein n=1 Tax=Volvox africanus TaxID=51714 RepID=A0A8J4AUV8_9CHLO|nr:hypothetical protein Vafri_2845 [Volvox africanus]